jgi:hypothetical protein
MNLKVKRMRLRKSAKLLKSALSSLKNKFDLARSRSRKRRPARRLPKRKPRRKKPSLLLTELRSKLLANESSSCRDSLKASRMTLQTMKDPSKLLLRKALLPRARSLKARVRH